MKTKENNTIQKAILFFLILISILLIILVMEKSGIIESKQNINKKLLNNGEMLISEDGVISKTVDSSNWDTNKVTAVTDSDGNIVPVPKGYIGSKVDGENKVNEGYVIYEGTTDVTASNLADAKKTRNQWVWIPVKDPSRVYEEVNGVKKAKLYVFTSSGRAEYKNRNYEPAILPEYDTTTNLSSGGLTGMTPDKLYQELQQEFDSTMESIEKYGGFYIGRYETGDLSKTKPVVKRFNKDINNQTWYAMYSKMGYLAANENVKTNMLWGCLWDETLQWLIDRQSLTYAGIATESNRWGNYSDATFSYTKVSGTAATKEVNTSVIIPSGGTSYTKKLNIYDLAGNIFEWTLETNGANGRVRRGRIIWR